MSPVEILIASIERGAPPRGAFARDAVFDATVPNWRFTLQGNGAVEDKLAEWFDSPGHFEELKRSPLPDGEVVEFSRTHLEEGVPFACHQVHVLTVAGERIVRDVVFCGGKWSAALLAEMEEAAHAH